LSKNCNFLYFEILVTFTIWKYLYLQSLGTFLQTKIALTLNLYLFNLPPIFYSKLCNEKKNLEA